MMKNRLKIKRTLQPGFRKGSHISRSGKCNFKSMGLEPHIEFIDTPEDIRDTYQYFTEADLSKLRRQDTMRSLPPRRWD